MNTFRLGLRMLWRDLRGGELSLPALCVALAVAALASMGLLADRVERVLTLQAHELLGGDLLLSADHPWAEPFRSEALRRGLALTESVVFFSMAANAQGEAQLCEVKAAAPLYPLRGGLRAAPALNAADAPVSGIPAPGNIWPDERLASALALADRAAVQLGDARFTVQKILTQDPERGVTLLSFAPRLLMNLADLPATGLMQPGSRVQHRLHLAGGEDAIKAFQDWAAPRLQRGERIESLDNARPEVRRLLERAQRFLRLAALLAVALAAVAAALAAQRYVRRHLDAAAVLRCLGASSRQIILIHGGEFILMGVAATLVGCVLGYLAQQGLALLLTGLFEQELPAPGAAAWLQGALAGAVLVAGFVLPPLLRLRDVSTLRVLRREWAAAASMSWAAYSAGVLLLAALLGWVAQGGVLAAVVLGGFMALTGLYAGGMALLLLGLRKMRGGGGWRYGLACLLRRRAATVLQGTALALGMTALLLLLVGHGSLLDEWRLRVPPDAPNRFVINIQPQQRAPFAALQAQAGLTPSELEPMVRGRLVAVDGREVSPADYPEAEERAQRLVEREFNLSWRDTLPPGNRLVEGAWPDASQSGAPQFSVEQGIADTLHLKLGARLEFLIDGERVAAPITSIRKLDWDSMRVNFFVIGTPGLLQSRPASYITSFYLPPAQRAFTQTLARALPNLTVIDVDALQRQLQSNFGQIANALTALFSFALLAGVAVLAAALQSSQDERALDLALMRALGARNAQLRGAVLAEFAILGACAGLMSGLGAAAIAWALAQFAFDLAAYAPDVWLPLLGGLSGLVGAAAIGWLGARRALRQAPLHVLRNT